MRDDDRGLMWEVEQLEPTARGKKELDFRRAAPPDHYELPTPFSFKNEPLVSLDIETFDPNLETMGPGPRRRVKEGGKLCGVGVATADNADYFPLDHDNAPNLPQGQYLDWLDSELYDYRGEITGANLLYDFDWLTELGVRIPRYAKFRDVQWAAPLLDESRRRYSLDNLLGQYLGEGKQTSELTRLYGADFIKRFHLIHPGHARDYVLQDIRGPIRLLARLKEELWKESYDAKGKLILHNLAGLYDIECRNFQMLLRMRQFGTRVDVGRADNLNSEIDVEITSLIGELHRLSGVTIGHTASTGDAAAVLDKLEIPYPTAESGAPSITGKFLKSINHPAADLIKGIRKLEKFRGTFVESYILNHNVDGRIHCTFHPLRGDQYGTISGRFSSSGPNLQNIPTKDERIGPLARSLFIPNDGHLWWARDYSQIEYRFLVHFAELIRSPGAFEAAEMYRNNPATDFHEMAVGFTGVPRKETKAINFGVAYGMGVPTMAVNLGVPLAQAKTVLGKFHENMPFLKDVFNTTMKRAERFGVIKTILGRKRRFDLFEERGKFGVPKDEREALPKEAAIEKWGEKKIQRAFCNKALNALLQGSAADLMKKAMGDAYEAGVFDGTGVHCSLTVHDELDGDTDDTPKAREALRELDTIMANAIKLTIPVSADGKTGSNWRTAKGD